MIRLLIVEDEYFEREHLCKLVRENFSEFVILTMPARDGMTAIEIAKEERPDIILLDIQLPKMNGIKAAEQIRVLLPDAIILVVTAYSSFEYARGAIDFGAKRYILKPYEDEDMIAQLEECVENAMARQKVQRKRLAERNMARYMNEILERELILAAIESDDTDRLRQYIDFLGVSECEACRCIALSIADACSTNAAHIKRILQNKYPVLIGYALGSGGVYFALEPGGAYEESCREARECVLQLLEQEGLVRCDVVISDRYQLHQMKLAYEDTMCAVEHRTVSRAYPHQFFSKELIAAEQALDKAMLRQDAAALEDAFSALHTCVCSCDDDALRARFCREYCRQIYLSCCKNAMQRSEIRLDTIDTIARLDRIGRQTDAHEALSLTKALLLELQLSIRKLQESDPSRVAERLKRFVELQYGSSITLSDAQRDLHFSYGYLSKCFIRATGMRFSDYLTKVRIDKAKELLLSTDRPATDIAYETGFSDPSYFWKTFKRITGLSPGQYKLRGKEGE